MSHHHGWLADFRVRVVPRGSSVDREVKAVDSEFYNNLNNDVRIAQCVYV